MQLNCVSGTNLGQIYMRQTHQACTVQAGPGTQGRPGFWALKPAHDVGTRVEWTHLPYSVVSSQCRSCLVNEVEK